MIGNAMPLPAPTRIIRLVVNPASGSHDPDLPARLDELARRQGATIDRNLAFPDDPLPNAAELDADGVSILAVHAGDGTINAAMHAAAGWTGALLPLPGGTMNLLSRHLHDSDDTAEILMAALAPDALRRHVTMVVARSGRLIAQGVVGLFAGPTTAWGEVRETLRRRDLASLADAVPRALDQTFAGNQVRIEGSANSWPAIYAEPREGRLRLLGFAADGAGDLFRHGFAWLGGDFRNGPHEELGEHEEVTIVADNGPGIGLLVDGEREHAHSPLTLAAAPSPVSFLTTRAPAGERPAA